MVKEVFLLKYERNCYLRSVKWKLILRTFVGSSQNAGPGPGPGPGCLFFPIFVVILL